jgi:hypothetical protein
MTTDENDWARLVRGWLEFPPFVLTRPTTSLVRFDWTTEQKIQRTRPCLSVHTIDRSLRRVNFDVRFSCESDRWRRHVPSLGPGTHPPTTAILAPPPTSPTTGSGRPRRRPHAAVWWRRATGPQGLPRNLTSEIHLPRARERLPPGRVASVAS